MSQLQLQTFPTFKKECACVTVAMAKEEGSLASTTRLRQPALPEYLHSFGIYFIPLPHNDAKAKGINLYIAYSSSIKSIITQNRKAVALDLIF